jgi:GR25 family glycosyltransferase involved in LPS biosynthesis
MKSLIIHLPDTQTRKKNVAALMEILPGAEVVDAVNGYDPAQTADVGQAPGTLHSPTYPFRLTPGEVGCFLSHKRCWEIIAQGEAPYGLIAEDDLVLDDAVFLNALSLAERYADEDSFFRFPAKARERPAVTVARQRDAALFLPRVIGLQAIFQLVGRNAARRMLDLTTVIDRPVDTLLQMHWITKQPVHSIYPNGTSELSDGSTIQSKLHPREVLMREIRRATYRAKVRRKPQTGTTFP